MTTLAQAAAIVAEFRRDVNNQSHKMANGFRGEMVAKFAGTEYKCVRKNGRVNWYVNGKLHSEKNATFALDSSLTIEREQLDKLLAANAPQVAQETRSDTELATMLLDEWKDYATTKDGRLLVNFQDKGVWRMIPGGETWEERETLVMHLMPRHRIMYATSAQAYEWLATSEQYTYCIDTLEISAHDVNADYLVNKFEARLTEILKLEGQHIE
jgi:hypothetical protein